ncbi:uncharacterized protein LOC129775027 [Toxorhynchites rutilus septentrionalis]|uniref:uncharacterized protein LOC129775027 n=1 Tax=Toxorhynchites rutilus septentrionalis TaxID=329112 RepID=UPI002478373B|nr:uncharacterized protein LOC129775027 [Toxorhynchites rutilus septentrionalis]
MFHPIPHNGIGITKNKTDADDTRLFDENVNVNPAIGDAVILLEDELRECRLQMQRTIDSFRARKEPVHVDYCVPHALPPRQPESRPIFEQTHNPFARSNYGGVAGISPISPTYPEEYNFRRPSAEQLAARHVMPRDLPDFSGDPEEWAFFYSSFCHTSVACGFSNAENLARLQRCLKGNALKSVRYYLLSPESAPEVIETLRTLFGRPEVIINNLIQNVHETPAPKPEKLEILIDLGMSVRNLTQHLVASGQQAHLSNPVLLQELVGKLPANIKLQWAQHIMFQQEANLQMFSNFMTTVVESVSKVVTYTCAQHSMWHQWMPIFPPPAVPLAESNMRGNPTVRLSINVHIARDSHTSSQLVKLTRVAEINRSAL